MVGSEILILVLYVDDLFLTGSLGLIEECRRDLAAKFEMKDLGLMHYFQGMEEWNTDGEIFLGQGKYCIEILRRYEMEDYRAMSTPMVTHDLMYLVTTIPYISFVLNFLSHFIVEPKSALDSDKACVMICVWYNQVWDQLFSR